MAWKDKITTSKHGQRLGLSLMTTGQTGGALDAEFLVGPEDVRLGVSTAETTSTNLRPFGVSHVKGTSADSSSVFTLEPPIPGVRKGLYFNSTGDTACYVKTANSETFHSTIGSSHTTIKSTIGGYLELMGVTTAIWGVRGLTSGTSSQAGGFTPTTST